MEAQKLDYLIDPNFQEVNKIFVYHLKIKQTEEDTGYYLPNMEIKGYNVMIDVKSFLINLLEIM